MRVTDPQSTTLACTSGGTGATALGNWLGRHMVSYMSTSRSCMVCALAWAPDVLTEAICLSRELEESPALGVAWQRNARHSTIESHGSPPVSFRAPVTLADPALGLSCVRSPLRSEQASLPINYVSLFSNSVLDVYVSNQHAKSSQAGRGICMVNFILACSCLPRKTQMASPFAGGVK